MSRLETTIKQALDLSKPEYDALTLIARVYGLRRCELAIAGIVRGLPLISSDPEKLAAYKAKRRDALNVQRASPSQVETENAHVF